MAKVKYQQATLACVVITGVLSALAIILIVASLSWQGLIEILPQYNSTVPGEVSCVFEVPRREGFFYVCHTMTPVNDAVNSPGIPCVLIDYGIDLNYGGENHDNYLKINESRRLSILFVALGLFLAFVGFAMLVCFARVWLRIVDRDDFRRMDRLLVGLSFLAAGVFCQYSLTFLHVTYMRDKVLKTNNIHLIYTSWEEIMGDNFLLRYSYSYKMLTTAMYFLEVAGIIVLFAGHFARMLSESIAAFDESMHGTLGYNPALQRYAVAEHDYNEFASHATVTPPPRINSEYRGFE